MLSKHCHHLFKITFCITCGYRPRAIRLQTELLEEFGDEVELVQSDGGVFEVEDSSIILFSKKLEGRFPIDGEVVNILRLLEGGLSLIEAKQQAKENIAPPPTFEEWYLKKIGSDAQS